MRTLVTIIAVWFGLAALAMLRTAKLEDAIFSMVVLAILGLGIWYPNRSRDQKNGYQTTKRFRLKNRFSYFWRTRSRAIREASWWEFKSEWIESSQEFGITLFSSRIPIKILLTIKNDSPYEVIACRASSSGDLQDIDFDVEYVSGTDSYIANVFIATKVEASEIWLKVDGTPDEFSWVVEPYFDKLEYDDLHIFEDSFGLFNDELWSQAMERTNEYLLIAPNNPHAMLLNAIACKNLTRFDEAEDFAVGGATNGRWNFGLETFQRIQEKCTHESIENLRQLQKDSRAWNIDGHHGVIGLRKEESFSLGLSGWYVRKYHSTWEVRRESAARFLTRLDFHYTNRDVLLYTWARVIHCDDSVEVLAGDKLSQSDGPTRNIFIESRIDLVSTWMLPDLEVGDLIDWGYSIAYRERKPTDGQSHLVTVEPLFGNFFPTFQAKLQYRMPTDFEVKFHCLNGAPPVGQATVSEDNRTKSFRFEGKQYEPVKETGYEFEDTAFNPIVACSSGSESWIDLTPKLISSNVSNEQHEGDLPEPLAGMISAYPDPFQCLEHIYYWVRDKIKYGSFEAGEAQIGSPERLKLIIQSGFGDCKDKAYLLREVCNRLGIDSHYVLVNAERGIVIEELPSDQFDHVFLAAKRDGNWLYLDAAGSNCVYGLPPLYCQGLKGLIDSNGGQIITLPEDAPEVNRVSVREVFDMNDGDWLTGEFVICAHGRSARKIDEMWKIYSLRQRDQMHSISQSLSAYMPRIVPRSVEKLSQTANSARFEVAGKHRRCQLSPTGDHLVGSLTWNDISLPLQQWRLLHANRFAGFEMPLELKFECVLIGEARQRLVNISDPPSYASKICKVEGQHYTENGKMTYSVKVVIPKRFVSIEDQDLVPGAMEHIEKAMRVSLIFQK